MDIDGVPELLVRLLVDIAELERFAEFTIDIEGLDSGAFLRCKTSLQPSHNRDLNHGDKCREVIATLDSDS